MGGVVLVDPDSNGLIVKPTTSANTVSPDTARMDDIESATNNTPAYIILDKDNLAMLIAQNPNFEILITEEDIQDKAKGDFLSKSIATLQVSWFVAQCVARFVQGLAVTELEVVTLALASLNALTYAFWWSKPLGLKIPFKVPVNLQEVPTVVRMGVDYRVRLLFH